MVQTTRHTPVFLSSSRTISARVYDLHGLTDDYSVHWLQKTATLISFTLLLEEINQYLDGLKHLAASHSALSLCCLTPARLNRRDAEQ